MELLVHIAFARMCACVHALACLLVEVVQYLHPLGGA